MLAVQECPLGDLTGLGQIGGGIGNGLLGINDVMFNDRVHSLIPASASGTINCADVSATQGLTNFFFYKMSIKSEFAEVIDDYFSMYGYKVNEVKIPNIQGRTNWNFVKLHNPNIEGTLIPEEDLNKYKRQLEEGITFWHNYSTFRDYSQTNNIVI